MSGWFHNMNSNVAEEPAPAATPVLLVATDLSDLDRLMPFAFQLAHQSNSRLILLHVLAATAEASNEAHDLPLYDPAEALDHSSKSMHPWCEMARRQDLICDALLREGQTAAQIAAAARQFHADRILLGSRSLGRLRRMTLGPVAEQVLRSVNLPVITVGPEAHLMVEASDHPRLIVHATTLRETSRPSAALASQIAARSSAKLLLLHVLAPAEEARRRAVMPSGELSVPLEEAAREKLCRLATELEAEFPIQIECQILRGNPTIEILATASDRQAYMIILGAQQNASLSTVTRDRTLYRVLTYARCPVLTLREGETEEQLQARLPFAMQS